MRVFIPVFAFIIFFVMVAFCQISEPIVMDGVVRVPARQEIDLSNIPGYKTLKCDFLIHTVYSDGIKNENMDAMNEQLCCFRPMGSHTSSLGSVYAIWFEQTGNEWLKRQASWYLKTSANMTYDNGVVVAGPDYVATWFSDGYSYYIRHFLNAPAAVPEWVPDNEIHLQWSSLVIQKVGYWCNKIECRTFDKQAIEKFRMVKNPMEIFNMNKELKEKNDDRVDGWI